MGGARPLGPPGRGSGEGLQLLGPGGYVNLGDRSLPQGRLSLDHTVRWVRKLAGWVLRFFCREGLSSPPLQCTHMLPHLQADWALSPNLAALGPPVVVVALQWGVGGSGPSGSPLMPEAVCRDCQSLSIIWGRYS